MGPEPSVHIQLDVARREGTLSGEAVADGRPPQPFVGWIGLNAVVDQLLAGETEASRSTAADRHRPIVIGPITVTFYVDAPESNGSVTVSRCDVADGAGMPVAHSHDAFEETIYGVAGLTTLVVDGARIEVGPGDAYCIPRGAVHTFSADHGAASFLAIATPGLFGPDYFQELKTVVDAAGGGSPDPEAVTTVMRRHGLTPAPPV